MSSRVVFDSKWEPGSRAVYEDYFDYYFFGLIGENHVDVQRVCMDQKPYAVRRLRSGEDFFISLVTFGIYTPATVRVWCGD
jgi:hypothetical protein